MISIHFDAALNISIGPSDCACNSPNDGKHGLECPSLQTVMAVCFTMRAACRPALSEAHVAVKYDHHLQQMLLLESVNHNARAHYSDAEWNGLQYTIC